MANNEESSLIGDETLDQMIDGVADAMGHPGVPAHITPKLRDAIAAYEVALAISLARCLRSMQPFEKAAARAAGTTDALVQDLMAEGEASWIVLMGLASSGWGIEDAWGGLFTDAELARLDACLAADLSQYSNPEETGCVDEEIRQAVLEAVPGHSPNAAHHSAPRLQIRALRSGNGGFVVTGRAPGAIYGVRIGTRTREGAEEIREIYRLAYVRAEPNDVRSAKVAAVLSQGR